MVLTRATNLPGPDGDPRHRRRHPRAGKHHVAVRRPEPDLHVASVAPGVPARVQARRQWPSGRDRQADHQPRPGRRRQVRHRRRHARSAAWPPGQVVKAQARDILGINLTDADVFDVPLLATDAYGNFIKGAHGFPQVMMKGADGIGRHRGRRPGRRQPRCTDQPGATRCRTGHQFLIDIAHNAVPVSRWSASLTATPPSTRGRPPAGRAPTTTSCSTRTTSPATAA